MTMTQEERVAQTRSTLDGLEGILDSQDLAVRQEHLETAEMLMATAQMTSRRLDVLIDLALGMATEGLEKPDRLITSYRIADAARSVASMAEQLANAEAMFESDLSDGDLTYVHDTLREVEHTLEMSHPTAPPSYHDHAECERILRSALS